MDEAGKKLQAEITGSNNNPYVNVIGEFMIKHIEANPVDADKIMAADKTIAKSLDAMKAEARKKAVNGMAMLTDAEGFAIVLKYFGIQANTPMRLEVAKAPSDTRSMFDVKLEDLI